MSWVKKLHPVRLRAELKFAKTTPLVFWLSKETNLKTIKRSIRFQYSFIFLLVEPFSYVYLLDKWTYSAPIDKSVLLLD